MYKIKNSDYKNLTYKNSIPVGKSEKRMKIVIMDKKIDLKKIQLVKYVWWVKVLARDILEIKRI